MDADDVDVQLLGEFLGGESLSDTDEHLPGDVDDDIRRAELHLRVGDAFESAHKADPARVLPELAHHFTLAVPLAGSDRAVDYSLRAAEAAIASAAYAEAVVLLETALELGIADATHAHRRLLPLLRAAATARLASRRGVELDRRPEAAEALLGEDVWELLRPDRPAPADRHGPGVPREQVAAAIERVESL